MDDGRCPGRWSHRFLLITSLALLSAHAAAAATLAGTVHYGGSLGPVSATRPIGVLVSDDPNLGGNQQVVPVNVNGGTFISQDVPPGTYYLAVFLDSQTLSPDLPLFPIVGEPFQIYNQRFTPPADAIVVPESGVSGLAIDFDDEHLLSGILGLISYTGHLGTVSKETRLVVFAYTDPNLTQWSGLSANQRTNGGPVEIVTLDTATYYLLAFFDLNGNRMPDTGEPFEVYNGKGMLPADPVAANTIPTGIDFAFGDEHLLPVPMAVATATPGTTPIGPTPTATHAGTPLPTPTPGPCVGDCDGSGTLVITELITGVNIALGVLPLNGCASFDCNHTGHVTVDCLVKAVSAALYGCR
jgi:hypothetical protein